MKLKFLSLFLALGVLALGTNLSAQVREELPAPAEGAPASTEVGVWEGKDEPTAATNEPSVWEKEEMKAQGPEFGCPCGSGATNTCGDFIKSKFLGILCPVVSTVNGDCGTFCSNIKNSAKTPPATVEACMNFIKTAPKVGQYVTQFMGLTCNVLCTASSLACSTCANSSTRAVCGYLCCPIDPNTIKNCMGSFGDSCSNYLGAGKEKGAEGI